MPMIAAQYDCNGEFDPASDGWTLASNPQWTDYVGGAGVSPAGDATLTGGAGTFALSHQTRYFGFAGQQSLDAGGSPTSTRYFHGDLIDSNVMTSNETGTPQATTAYTAFGEAAGGPGGPGVPPGDPSALGTRYQYAGAYGYEAGMLSVTGANATLPPLTLAHVGARWYQPGTGGFVQRDPIGLRGGINAYGYCAENPLRSTDPTGLQTKGPGGIEMEWPRPTPQPPRPICADEDPLAKWIFDVTSPPGRPKGGYIGAGVGKNPVISAGVGGGWTIDEGFFGYICISFLFITYGEGGWDIGIYGSGTPPSAPGRSKRGLDIGGGWDDGGFGTIGGDVPIWGPICGQGGIYVY